MSNITSFGESYFNKKATFFNGLDSDEIKSGKITVGGKNNFISGVSTFSANSISVDNGYLNSLKVSGVSTADVVEAVTKYNHNGLDASRGPIVSLSISNPGSGYVDGNYTNVALTNVSASGASARAFITVSGGSVTGIGVSDEGWGYYAGDTLTASDASLGSGGGSGFQATAASVREVDAVFYGNPVRIRLQNSDTSTAVNQEMGAILFGVRDTSTGGSGDKARIVCYSRSTSGGGYLMFQTASNAGEPVDTLRILDGNGLFYKDLDVTQNYKQNGVKIRGFQSYAILSDVKGATTDGGASSNTTWHQRTLNTESDPDGIVSLASNQFTLSAGSYLIQWSTAGYRCRRFSSTLTDTTNTTEYPGTSMYFDDQDSATNTISAGGVSTGVARVTLTASATFRIYSYSEFGIATNGLGLGHDSTGYNNVYTHVTIFKELEVY